LAARNPIPAAPWWNRPPFRASFRRKTNIPICNRNKWKPNVPRPRQNFPSPQPLPQGEAMLFPLPLRERVPRRGGRGAMCCFPAMGEGNPRGLLPAQRTSGFYCEMELDRQA
jgi:hypothetical protein